MGSDDAGRELAEVMVSLCAVMREETQRLEAGTRALTLGELAEAKARLVGTLEERLARLTRQAPQWNADMDGSTRQEFVRALEELQEASAANAAMLQRHIEMSADLMAAISAEAKRMTGSRTYAYGSSGTMARADLTTPISLNGQF